MSLLSELTTLLHGLGVPVETGVFKGKAPHEYVVVTPFSDTFELFADNLPNAEVKDARLSLFSKGNYLDSRDKIVRALLEAGFTITDRLYVDHEDDTEYHHYAIDVAKEYDF
jgi:hypothetical protein